MTQYFACVFREGETRAYTYAYDGDEPLAIGDKVMVPGKNGDPKTVIVHLALDAAPEPGPFEIKAIIGKKADPEQERLDLIDKWHDTDQSVPLHEFLGMTWDEYSAWVSAGNKSGFDRIGDGKELPA